MDSRMSSSSFLGACISIIGHLLVGKIVMMVFFSVSAACFMRKIHPCLSMPDQMYFCVSEIATQTDVDPADSELFSTLALSPIGGRGMHPAVRNPCPKIREILRFRCHRRPVPCGDAHSTPFEKIRKPCRKDSPKAPNGRRAWLQARSRGALQAHVEQGEGPSRPVRRNPRRRWKARDSGFRSSTSGARSACRSLARPRRGGPDAPAPQRRFDEARLHPVPGHARESRDAVVSVPGRPCFEGRQ